MAAIAPTTTAFQTGNGITLRADKGSELTHEEMDRNFSTLKASIGNTVIINGDYDITALHTDDFQSINDFINNSGETSITIGTLAINSIGNTTTSIVGFIKVDITPNGVELFIEDGLGNIIGQQLPNPNEFAISFPFSSSGLSAITVQVNFTDEFITSGAKLYPAAIATEQVPAR